MQDELRLYCKSMGKIFRVRKVCMDEDYANRYCATHRDVAVIAEDTEEGLIYIADVHSLTVKSDILPD
mgnify:CR=1 FL=1